MVHASLRLSNPTYIFLFPSKAVLPKVSDFLLLLPWAICLKTMVEEFVFLGVKVCLQDLTLLYLHSVHWGPQIILGPCPHHVTFLTLFKNATSLCILQNCCLVHLVHFLLPILLNFLLVIGTLRLQVKNTANINVCFTWSPPNSGEKVSDSSSIMHNVNANKCKMSQTHCCWFLLFLLAKVDKLTTRFGQFIFPNIFSHLCYLHKTLIKANWKLH